MTQSSELNSALREMSVEDLTDLQRRIRLEKQRKHISQGIRFTGYIPEGYRDIIPIILDYLKENDIIKKRSIYNLATMSIRLVIDDVIDKIKEKGEMPKTS